MHVTSTAGTDLVVNLENARVGGGWGYTTRPAPFRTGRAACAWPPARAASTARW